MVTRHDSGVGVVGIAVTTGTAMNNDIVAFRVAMKHTLCRAIGRLPTKYWAPLSAVLRRLWPGVRCA